MARNRRAGPGTRGSKVRAISASNVVTEIPTRAKPSADMGANGGRVVPKSAMSTRTRSTGSGGEGDTLIVPRKPGEVVSPDDNKEMEPIFRPERSNDEKPR